MSDSKPTILLVEDNDEDVFLLRRALKKGNIDCTLHTAQDGEEAINYLRGTGKYEDRSAFPMPSLVLLDLKLPYVNGFEVLAWTATQPSCKGLRIIILTSSGEEGDRGKAEQFGIAEYFLKPPTHEVIAAVAKALHEHRQRHGDVQPLDPKSVEARRSTGGDLRSSPSSSIFQTVEPRITGETRIKTQSEVSSIHYPCNPGHSA